MKIKKEISIMLSEDETNDILRRAGISIIYNRCSLNVSPDEIKVEFDNTGNVILRVETNE